MGTPSISDPLVRDSKTFTCVKAAMRPPPTLTNFSLHYRQRRYWLARSMGGGDTSLRLQSSKFWSSELGNSGAYCLSRRRNFDFATPPLDLHFDPDRIQDLDAGNRSLPSASREETLFRLVHVRNHGSRRTSIPVSCAGIINPHTGRVLGNLTFTDLYLHFPFCNLAAHESASQIVVRRSRRSRRSLKSRRGPGRTSTQCAIAKRSGGTVTWANHYRSCARIFPPYLFRLPPLFGWTSFVLCPCCLFFTSCFFLLFS